MALVSEQAKNFVRVVVGFALVVGALVVFFIKLPLVRSVIAGPQPITTEELLKLQSPSDLRNRWVTVKGDGVQDTGIKKTTAYFWGARIARIKVLRLKDNGLIVEAPETPSPNFTYTGYLMPASELTKEDLEAAKLTLGAIKDKLLPFQMDAESDHRTWCYTWIGIIGGLGLVGLILAGVAGFQLMRAEPSLEKKAKGKAAARDEEEDQEEAERQAAAVKKKAPVPPAVGKAPPKKGPAPDQIVESKRLPPKGPAAPPKPAPKKAPAPEQSKRPAPPPPEGKPKPRPRPPE